MKNAKNAKPPVPSEKAKASLDAFWPKFTVIQRINFIARYQRLMVKISKKKNTTIYPARDRLTPPTG